MYLIGVPRVRPRSLAAAIGLLLCVSICSPAMAGNWPAWRGDGSGLASDASLPTTWSPTENIRWKTAIPGDGRSSPIIWGDDIFLTTAHEGVKRQFIERLLLIVLLGLTLGSVWWAVNNLFRTRQPYHPDAPKPGFLQRLPFTIAKVFLFVAVVFGVLAGLRWMDTLSPGSNPFFSSGSEVVYSLPEFKGLTRWAGAWALCGLVAAVFIWSINRLTDALARRGAATVPGETDNRSQFIEPLLAICTTGVFLGMVLLSVSLTQTAVYKVKNTWTQDSLICSMGAVAVVAAFRSTSLWRLFAALLGVAVLVIFALGPPDDPMRWWFAESSRRKILHTTWYSVTLLCILYLCYRMFMDRRARDPEAQPVRQPFSFGPWAMLALLVTFFVASRVIVPQAALMRSVICLDRNTGDMKWLTSCASYGLENFHTKNSAATPTPVTDGKHVFANFGDAGTYCLDFDGNIVWSNRDPAPRMRYGTVSSPVLWDNVLVVTNDGDDENYTVGLDATTGKVIWRIERPWTDEDQRPIFVDAYATPLLVTDVRPQFVHNSRRWVSSFDPKTGEELWRIDTIGGQVVPSPLKVGDKIIIPQFGQGPLRIAAVRVTESGDEIKPEMLWEVSKGVPIISSPVAHNGYLFAVTDKGIATCRDIETGDLLWRERLDGQYYASVTAGGGHVFFSSLDGLTVVFDAAPEAHEVSKNNIEEPIYTNFAFADGDIFIRGTKHLFCISDKK